MRKAPLPTTAARTHGWDPYQKRPLPEGWEVYWGCLEVHGRFETVLVESGRPWLDARKASGFGTSEVAAWNAAVLAAQDKGKNHGV